MCVCKRNTMQLRRMHEKSRLGERKKERGGGMQAERQHIRARTRGIPMNTKFTPHRTNESRWERATKPLKFTPREPQFIHLDHIHTDNDTAPIRPG